FYIIHRACDAGVGCDAAQQSNFKLPPGHDVDDWAATLANVVGATVRHVRITGTGSTAVACNDNFNVCTQTAGLTNHVSWPDGLAAEDFLLKNDWEGDAVEGVPGMLGFLRQHPHP